ncbi:MAG: Hint domain-containing protein [Acidobacteria bacterium]|nr:Hint domain-containing protein [Acidobacteriota bacterium]
MLRLGTTGYEVYRNGEGGAGVAYATAVETKRAADIFLTVAGLLEGARGSAREAPQGPCFLAGTKVATPEGEKNIEEIKEGDYVLAADAESGKPVRQRVAQVFRRESAVLLDIKVAGETIKTTPEHRFWVEGKGWVAAGELGIGSRLVTKEGKIVCVKSIKRHDGLFKVYNLEVENAHTYFVGKSGVLVHNQYGPNGPSFLGQANGPAIPIPQGATEIPIVTPGGKVTGFGYTGGNGGNGLSPRVSDVRVMDPTLPRGPSPGYPNGYVNYMNPNGQAVNPYTGKTISKSDPMWHIPLN